MNYILFDGPRRNHLLPFTFTRPVAEIRVGIMTLRERWDAFLKVSTSSFTEDYLSVKYPIRLEDVNVFIDASVLPTVELVKAVHSLQKGDKLMSNELVVAYSSDEPKSSERINEFNLLVIFCRLKIHGIFLIKMLKFCSPILILLLMEELVSQFLRPII